ncbi:hypothetical protein ACHAPG_010801 [Botrytis cinerea]
MIDPRSGLGADPVLLLFGPQALKFDAESFKKLCIRERPHYQWVLETVTALSSEWNDISKANPSLQHYNGMEKLEQLKAWVSRGEISKHHSSFPLPNILLSPLVVITQLIQYWDFLIVALPDLKDTDELLTSITTNAETLGLCTGMLSAFAVACSSSIKELQQYGAVAVRLAMLTGAFVDAKEELVGLGEAAVSFSLSLNPTDSGTALKEALRQFPEAYISLLTDEKRMTITTSEQTASSLIPQLKLAGIQATKLVLRGRFHWAKHQEDIESLIQSCTPKFQLPDASKMALPSRSNTGGKYLMAGKLHEIALRSILVEQSQWYKTFSVAYSSHLLSSNASCICFGTESCVPPTIARQLGSRLIQVGGIDLSTSQLPGELLGTHRTNAFANIPDERVAVVGMACQLPGAEDLEEYWKILSSGKSQHTEIPQERFSMETAWREADSERKWFGNFVENYNTFDHKFFKKSPREMASTDPQHRLMLQIAYQTVEQSGYFGSLNADKHIGCFLGVGNVDYEANVACYPATAYSATGNLKSFVAGKISHYFGWTGPSLTIDTACSSSSVSIHYACRSILSGECNSALAGGINIITSPNWYHNLSGASFLSPTGQCKPFDAKGDGYCRGEGVGAVLLKKLSSAVADGDQVLGVISSTGVYQNGNDTAITVPISDSLSDLFLHVLQKAKLEPKDISVVEAHGTGTPVGDPAEYKGIQRVFGGPGSSHKVSLTSVKGLIGHTECASGVASLLKVILMVQEGFIPPQASFTSVNPNLGLTPDDKIEISAQIKPWEVEFRAALINNYGASGSNASMVVTQAPKLISQVPSKLPSNRTYPFWFCGNDEHSLRAYITKLLGFLRSQGTPGKDLSTSNLSFQVSRQSNRSLDWALIFNCNSSSELQDKLAAHLKGEKSITAIRTPSTRPVILCFGGQVSTYVGLNQEIYDTIPLLRRYLDQCDAIFISMDLGSIYPDIFQKSPVQDIVKLHSILFALQYSTAKCWIDCGIKVAAAIGHSFGELTALCVSNALPLKHAIEMITGRAHLIQQKWTAERGCMMAVEADAANVNALVAKSKNVAIACYNGPRSFTLAGTGKAIDSLEEMAKSDPTFSGVKLKKLNVTNAFHCHLVDPLMEDLEKFGMKLVFREPDFPLETATEYEFTDKRDEKFVARHLRSPVFFHHAVQRIAKKHPDATWLEAGSNSTVTTMASRALGSSGASSSHFQPINITSDNSFNFLAEATSRLWKEGLRVLFWAHHPVQASSYTPVILPPYQFEKSKHWMDLKKAPKLEPLVVKTQTKELPKGLTTFVGYQDEANHSALFQVNTKTERFARLVSGHIMASVAAVCPGIFQMELALDALMSLRPEFANLSFRPELQRMQHYHPLVPDDSKLVWIEAISQDPQHLVWDWKIVATKKIGSASTQHTSGAFAFRPANDTQLQAELEGYERWVSRKRCIRLLERRDADDVLQGRNIYRGFSQIIDYKELYRHVNIIVGKDDESAGRVTKTHIAEPWLDSILTDCFCQVAGIFVNLMTDRSDMTEGGIFVCDGIGRWFRSPKMGPDTQLDHWEVFALHHPESEKKYISDVFVFDPRDGSLVEVILRISYQWVAVDGIRKALSAPAPSGHHLPTVTPAPSQTSTPAPTLAPALVNGWKPQEKKKKKEKKAAVKQQRPDVIGKTREIICNLSGLEPDEVKDNSDLIELGIDSLMSMELTREVNAAFQCLLDTAQLMDLTDFQSLVICIQTMLGLDSQGLGNISEAHDTASGESGEETATNGTMNRKINGVNSVVKGSALSASIVLDAFQKASKATDEFIVNGHLGTYYNEIMPKSTELCVIYILDAFEVLGVNIRATAPGHKIERVPYLPKHEQLMNLIYDLLCKDARLIDINGSEIIRTAVAPPTKSADALLGELLRNAPVHAAEHKLTKLTGERFADCITGKADGLQLIFGTPEGREIATDLYAKSPINGIWIQQAEYFLETLVAGLPKDGEPLCILEMGAGTGGTTIKMVQLLARLGIPVKYTITDLSSSLVVAARKRFKQYKFLEFKVLDIEAAPDSSLLHSQHIVLATNCVHATRNLTISTTNIHKILRPDGFLLLIEMTEQVPWVDFIFGLLEGWWLFNDGRQHALQPPTYWEKILSSVGFGHIDWTRGNRPEANIQRLIIALADGSRYDPLPKPHLPTAQMVLTKNTVRQTAIDVYAYEYSKEFFFEPRNLISYPVHPSNEKYCVLVTGTTGSLGSHIVAYFAQLPEVETVVCLNRLSMVDATLRQQQSFALRGISLDKISMSKLRIIETDTAKSMLGLPKSTFQYLTDNVTHIVHNAWPMSLTRTVSAYESQFKVMRNLIALSSEATSQRPAPFKLGFQFISSIGVIGYYPLWTGKVLAPEESMPVDSVLPVGYADAKLVCERMLDETLHRYPEHFRPMAVRIAQIAGSTSNGYWNPVEHFASFLKSSQTLNILPDLKGTLSWCTVQDVAATLGELLISKTPPYPIYHIENPSRQPWPDMIMVLANELGIPSNYIVPFDEWLSRVRRFPGSTNDNPAGQLVEFFDKHFVRMSCGGLILDTVKSQEHSKTIRSTGPVSIDLVRKYILSWKSSGFLS